MESDYGLGVCLKTSQGCRHLVKTAPPDKEKDISFVLRDLIGKFEITC